MYVMLSCHASHTHVSALDDNFIHNDLHPGNILVSFDADRTHDPGHITDLAPATTTRSITSLFRTATPTPTLVILDCALVTELNTRNRANFLALFAALVEVCDDVMLRCVMGCDVMCDG